MLTSLDSELSEQGQADLAALMGIFRLPANGVALMAIREVASEVAPDEEVFKGVTGEDFLLGIADRFERKPPATLEEQVEFAGMLRYAAQFMTTRIIPVARFTDEQPNPPEAECEELNSAGD